MDHVVSQSLHSVLVEIYDHDFKLSNFGFRHGKSQHLAIHHVKRTVEDGYTWCASIDLQGFFDEIPHALIFKLIRRKIQDERLVTLIARALKMRQYARLSSSKDPGKIHTTGMIPSNLEYRWA